MAEYELLGLFEEVEPAAAAVESLRNVGASERNIEVLSAFPVAPKILGRKHPYQQVGLVALAGGLIGLMASLFFTMVTPQLYPVMVGGRPLVNGPPLLIVMFELTMLGILVGAFLGFLWQGGFPSIGGLYDKRIADGYVGVLTQVDAELLEKIERAYRDNGAVDLLRAEIKPHWNPRMWIGGGVLVVGLILNVALLAVSYDIIHLGFLPDQMKEQVSFAPQMGPRLPAPEGVVPVQGAALVGGRPATAPLPATEGSLQRGEVLYDLHCAVCHGPRDEEAVTTTTVGAYFPVAPPAMTGARVTARQAEQVFVFITNGVGTMPSLAENLDPLQRWDVVNYVQAPTE